MASLTGQSVASSYEQLLHVDRDGGGNGTTLVDLKDGDNGTTFALQLATDKINVTGNLIVGQTTAEQKFEVHGGGIRIAGNIAAPSSGVTGALIDYFGSDTRFWSRGADASTVGSFKFIGLESDGGNQSTQLEIDSNGNITSPANPAFNVQNSADHNNIAVGSAYIDKTFDTEIFDQGSNFASNVFTAPVTGKYLLISKLAFQQADASDALLYNKIVTSNRDYQTIGGGGLDADSTMHLDVTVVADMDANDTAKVQYRQIGGSAQADVVTSSFFAGYLLG
jgi:hypothetical protein|tara:strand:+ start:198 stop:1037 length:840 start_codon:yes stop_codon:yes gene_type:complete